ncbi:hypothetical protein EKO04_003757 [Ascochyta lentis]|uniref:NAD-dependent epimerase/dehydratase domain-containing protein n=1 Tax=Ascochyta lentis TaxID=205686 RepID=A0A8H7J834_9PLEO|nr:hypothetical protein EKO04_003757 [Ascochyta lentis]
MAPKLLLTGGTGYIGGSVLHTLASTHPDWAITVLLRRTPANFASTYPHIKVIQGDYDSAGIISAAAEDANIVMHCGNSDHSGSLNAIIAGLERRSSPGYLIHLSGTGIVSDWSSPTHLGRLNPKVWSDASASDLQEIRNLPNTALHRNTEVILHQTIRESTEKINVAIMCPPDIYGRGKGLFKTQSALIPLCVKESKTLGRVFLVGKARNDGKETQQYFGENGYHFASTQEWSHLDFSTAVGKLLSKHGVVADSEPVQVDLERLDAMANFPGFPKLARYLYASNSRTRADKAASLWGYEGEAPGLMEALEEDVLDAIREERS